MLTPGQNHFFELIVVLNLYDPDNGRFYCFGRAPSKERRCHNSIRSIKVHEMLDMLQELSTVEDLHQVMSLGLCYRHGDQQDTIKKWTSLWIRMRFEGRRKTFIMCTDDLPLEAFRTKPFTSACAHDVNTCNTCLGNWLDESLANRGWDKITCPECSAPFQHADVERCATRTLFERYDELLTRATVSTIRDFRWCLAPQCRSGQIPAPDNPLFVCVDCGFRHCTRHKVPWHEGETCQEYEYRKSGRKQREDEEQTRLTIERTTKTCPGCGVNIEKNKGCNHMTCRSCRHEFCWLCLAPYDPIRRHGNSMHRQSCLYYAY